LRNKVFIEDEMMIHYCTTSGGAVDLRNSFI